MPDSIAAVIPVLAFAGVAVYAWTRLVAIPASRWTKTRYERRLDQLADQWRQEHGICTMDGPAREPQCGAVCDTCPIPDLGV